MGLVRGGDWSRPCRRCGSNDGPFSVGATRNGVQYRKSYCDGCARALLRQHDHDHPEQASRRQKRRNRDFPRERQTRWSRDPEGMRRNIRARNVRRQFKITLDEYEARLALQDGKCAICATEMQPPCLDHCHQSGRLRQFLCVSCNAMIGMAREQIDVLVSAVRYLENHHGRG